MLKKLVILVCLVAFAPAAVGAQDVAAVSHTPLATEGSATVQAAREVDLSLAAARAATVMAANEAQGQQAAKSERPKKTHYGLTFQEFVDVHFGDYRWVWWAGAAAALIAIHVAAKD